MNTEKWTDQECLAAVLTLSSFMPRRLMIKLAEDIVTRGSVEIVMRRFRRPEGIGDEHWDLIPKTLEAYRRMHKGVLPMTPALSAQLGGRFPGFLVRMSDAAQGVPTKGGEADDADG